MEKVVTLSDYREAWIRQNPGKPRTFKEKDFTPGKAETYRDAYARTHPTGS